MVEAKQLKPGEYDTVIPVTDSVSGQTVPLVVQAEIPPRDQLPPLRRHLPLVDYITDLMRDIPPLGPTGSTGVEAALFLMKHCAWRYDELRRFVVAYEDLSSIELHPQYNGTPSFEDACDLAGIEYDHLVGLLGQACYWYGITQARVAMHLGLPLVIKASQDTARMVGKDGFNDRKLLMQANGLVQDTPTIVNNNSVNTNTQVNTVVGLPKWDEVDKLLTTPILTVTAEENGL